MLLKSIHDVTCLVTLFFLICWIISQVVVVVVQLLSHVWFFVTPWTAARQASLSFSLLKLMSIESVMPSNYLILCCPLLLLPQSFPASRSFPMSWFFASGGQSIGASASVLPLNIQGWFSLGLTGLISFLSKGLSRSSPAPQFKSIILWLSSCFMVKLSHLYKTTGKTIALTIQTFVGEAMSLLFNMLSSFISYTFAYIPSFLDFLPV